MCVPSRVAIRWRSHKCARASQRPSKGLRLKKTWKYTTSTTMAVFMGFNDVPFYLGSSGGSYYEWYSWPDAQEDERTWFEDKVEKKDIYHCASAYCGSYGQDGLS